MQLSIGLKHYWRAIIGLARLLARMFYHGLFTKTNKIDGWNPGQSLEMQI